LRLEPPDQTCLGTTGMLGVDAVAGDRVWDIRAKFRIRLGPLSLRQFEEFLPVRTPARERKSLFVLGQLVRLFVGPELDFDIQLVLNAAEVPECRMVESGFGSRLGWNTWLLSESCKVDADDPVFNEDDYVWTRQ
jgi:type VI secretion system protein ImpH